MYSSRIRSHGENIRDGINLGFSSYVGAGGFNGSFMNGGSGFGPGAPNFPPGGLPPPPGAPGAVSPTFQPPDFVVAPDGTVFPVPEGATGLVDVINPQGNRVGAAFTGGTFAGRQNVDLRLMNGNRMYPNGYAVYSRNLPQGGHQNLDLNGQTGNPSGMGSGGITDRRGPHWGW